MLLKVLQSLINGSSYNYLYDRLSLERNMRKINNNLPMLRHGVPHAHFACLTECYKLTPNEE